MPLQSSGSLTGRLLKAGSTVEPAPLSTVSVSAGAYQRTAVSSPDGTFGFAPVPAGGVNLSAAVVGGIDRARGTADVPVDGVADVTLTLNGVGSLTGETRSTTGPISGRLVLTGTGAFPWQKVLYTPANGQFALPELLAGPFTAQLQATVGGFPLYGSATGVIVSGANAELVISVQPSGTVIGRVVRADGTTPAVGATVVVRAQNGASATVSAGPDGTFSAPGVPVGNASLRVQDQTTGGVAFVPAARGLGSRDGGRRHARARRLAGRGRLGPTGRRDDGRIARARSSASRSRTAWPRRTASACARAP